MRKDTKLRKGASHKGWQELAMLYVLIFKACLCLCVNRALEKGEEQQEMADFNADKAGTSRNMIIILSSITTEEKKITLVVDFCTPSKREHCI